MVAKLAMKKNIFFFVFISSIIPFLFFFKLIKENFPLLDNFLTATLSILSSTFISYTIYYIQSAESRKLKENQKLLYDHAYAGLIDRLEDILTRRKEKLNKQIFESGASIDIFVFVPKSNKYIVLASSETKASLSRKIELDASEGVVSSTFQERIPLISKFNGNEKIFTRRGEFYENARPLSKKNLAYCANEIKSIACIPMFSPPRNETPKDLPVRDIIGVISFDFRISDKSYELVTNEPLTSQFVSIAEEVEAYVLADFLLSN